jgi:hypothetical protein
VSYDGLYRDSDRGHCDHDGFLDPEEIPVVGFENERFTTEVRFKLGNSEISSERFLLEGVPVDGCARVFVALKGDGLVCDGTSCVSVVLVEDSANSDI